VLLFLEKCASLHPSTHSGSLQRSPRPLAVFKGPTSKTKEGEGEEIREREGEGKGRGKTTLHTPCRKFLATPLDSGLGNF